MGRVSRHKKIKAFDPFSKTGGRVAEPESVKRADVAPKSDRNYIPSKLRQLMKFKEKFANKSKDAATGDKKPSESRPSLGHIKSFPGESMRSYAQRVNTEARRLKEQAKLNSGPVRPISEKRKEFLEAKREKKKAKRAEQAANQAAADDANETPDGPDYSADIPVGMQSLHAGKKRRRDSDDDFPAPDRVSFGERVDAPPKLSVAPRPNKVMRQEQALAILREQSVKGSGEASHAAGASFSSSGTGFVMPKFKRLPTGPSSSSSSHGQGAGRGPTAEETRAAAVRQATVDAERDKVRAAYSDMKKKRMEALRAEAKAAGGPSHGGKVVAGPLKLASALLAQPPK